MALGNWSRYCIHIAGNIVPRTYLKMDKKVSACLYKNWIYVNLDATTIGEFWFGQYRIHRIFLYAIRGPQNGIYALIQKGYISDSDYSVYAWAGVYGYDENGEFVGVTDESKAFLQNLIDMYNKGEINLVV